MRNRTNDPLSAFRFLVRVGDQSEISAAFARVSGIRMQVETIEFRSCDDIRGVRDYCPVFTRFEPITLSKGVVGDNAFMDWLFSASARSVTGPSGKNLKRTLRVIAVDERGLPSVEWVLHEAMPMGYELSPMDSSRSEVLVENMTFSYVGMTREVKPPQ